MLCGVSVLFNSLNACPLGLAPFLGTACNNPSPVAPLGSAFIRTTLAPAFTPAAIPGLIGCLTGGGPCSDANTQAKDLMNFYNVTSAYLAGITTGNVPAAFQSLLGVPAAPGYNEQRKLTGSPDKADWQETTGRIGLDWHCVRPMLPRKSTDRNKRRRAHREQTSQAHNQFVSE
jgi:hypothetical protein